MEGKRIIHRIIVRSGAGGNFDVIFGKKTQDLGFLLLGHDDIGIFKMMQRILKSLRTHRLGMKTFKKLLALNWCESFDIRGLVQMENVPL